MAWPSQTFDKRFDAMGGQDNLLAPEAAANDGHGPAPVARPPLAGHFRNMLSFIIWAEHCWPQAG